MASKEDPREAGAARPSRARRRWRVLLLCALPAAALLFLALFEFRIPLDFLRPRVEQLVRNATGLALRLEGPAYALTGPGHGFEMHDVTFRAPTAGGEMLELLRVGRLRWQISLVALLDRELRILSVQASDAEIRFDAEAFAALGAVKRRESAAREAPSSDDWRLVEATRVDVLRARGYVQLPALTRPLRLQVDALGLRAAEGRPLTIDARGALAGRPMLIAFRTASIADLAAGVRRIPLEARFDLADASIDGRGTLDLQTLHGDYALAVSGKGSFIERMVPGFQAALGEVGEVSARGRLRTAPEGTALESVQLAFGRTRASGALQQRSAGDRLAIRGRLDFETLDLRPWLPLLQARDGAPRPAGGGMGDALERLRAMQRSADVDVGVRVGRLLWPQREAQDVEASLRAGTDAVALQLKAQLRKSPLEAQARLDTAQDEARLRVEAKSGAFDLEALHPDLARAGVGGTVRGMQLALRAAGASTPELLRSLQGELELQGIDARWRRDRQGEGMQIKLDAAQLAATRDTLRGAFKAAIDDARLELKLESARAPIVAEARVVESTFALSMRRSRQRDRALNVRGTLRLEPKRWTVDVKEARLGKTRGGGTLRGAWDGTAPLDLALRLAYFEKAALEFFDFDSVRRGAKPLRWEEIPVLPGGVTLPSADLDLLAARVEAAPYRFENLRLRGRSRDGRLETLQVETRAKAGALRGELSADLRGRDPRLSARLAARDFDARQLLERLGVALDRATAKKLDAKLELRGARLGEAVAQSTLQFSAQGFDAAMPGLLDERRRLRFEGKVDASSLKGRLLVSAEGALNGKAFRARSRGPELATLMTRVDRVAVDIDLSVADSALGVHGVIAKGPQADVAIRLSAKRANELLALGGLESRARGALSASAQLKLTPPARYAFEQLDVRLGASALSGRVVADWSAARPSLDAELAGAELRLRDLGVNASDAEAEMLALEKADAKASPAPDWIAPLRRFDARVKLNVERLFAAGELLGSLQAETRLEAGRLHVGPLALREGDRALRAEGEVDAASAIPAYVLDAELRDYDLTPLLRSFKLSSQGTASFDARAALRSRGLGKDVVSNLSGAFDIASYGAGVGSGAIELMGIDPLGLVLNTLERTRESKINCAVGVFDLDKGVMKSRALFVDTTRLRIVGNFDVDLGMRTLHGAFRPHPKNPRLFNVSTPIDISGTFEQPRVSLATSALPALLIRYSNPYTMFLGTLIETEGAKADGQDDCRAAYARTHAARPEGSGGWQRLFKFLQ